MAKMWYESESVQVTFDKWIGTKKSQEVVEVDVSWDLEDEHEGRVAVSAGVEIGENWWLRSDELKREFYDVNFEDERDVKMLEKAKEDLVARIKNVHNDVSVRVEIKELMNEGGRRS